MVDFSKIENNLFRTYNRMASGKRINSARDDAAGLAIADRMTSKVNELRVRQNNMRDEQNRINVASGSFRTIADSIQTLRELAVQAANDTYSTGDRNMIQSQALQVVTGLDDIAQNTTFNGQQILKETFGFDISSSGLNIDDIDLSSVSGANDAITKLDQALEKINTYDGKLGAQSNAIDSRFNAAANEAIHTAEARSRIEDADYAKLSSEKQKYEILMEAKLLTQKKEQELEKNKFSLLI